MVKLLVYDPITVIPAKNKCNIGNSDFGCTRTQEKYNYAIPLRILNKLEEKNRFHRQEIVIDKQLENQSTDVSLKKESETTNKSTKSEDSVIEGPWYSKVKDFSQSAQNIDRVNNLTDVTGIVWIGDESIKPSPKSTLGMTKTPDTNSSEEDIKTITICSNTKKRKSDSEEKIRDLTAFTVKQLKDQCRHQGLPTHGKKSDLVSRLSYQKNDI